MLVAGCMPEFRKAGELSSELLRKRTAPCLVILDEEGCIVSAEPRLNDVLQSAGFATSAKDRLPSVLEETVRHLVATKPKDAPSAAAVPVQGLLLQVSVLVGPQGLCLAVSLEIFRTRDPLNGASERFRLTAREREVLQLILHGLDAGGIAARLHIAQATVREYFKKLYAKTGARNRTGMLAKVFDWPEESY